MIREITARRTTSHSFHLTTLPDPDRRLPSMPAEAPQRARLVCKMVIFRETLIFLATRLGGVRLPRLATLSLELPVLPATRCVLWPAVAPLRTVTPTISRAFTW